jgi:hypothetical protein
VKFLAVVLLGLVLATVLPACAPGNDEFRAMEESLAVHSMGV